MKSFIRRLHAQDLKLHKKICWTNDIIELLVEIEYEGTFFDIKVIDDKFTEKQCKIIEREIIGPWVVDEIFGEMIK
ncbi:MAG: hypothetical protein PHR19_02365 [Bacteroidales bacterium]|nr:hypothetical protein [Bacteroidales bacterium]